MNLKANIDSKSLEDYTKWWNKALNVQKESLDVQNALGKTEFNNIKRKEELERKQAQAQNKVLENTYKQQEADKKRTLELEKQIALFQKRMQLETQRVSGKYGDLIDTNSLNNFKSQLSGLSISTPEVENKMKNMSLGLKEIELNAKGSASALRLAQQDADSFGNILAKDFQKFSLWFGIGTIFMSFIHGIKDSIGYLTVLDNSLNEIRIVTGKTDEEVTKLAKSYNNLAKEMGVTTKEIASEAANLFRQGLDETQVEERMKAIIQYAKISSISLADSDKIITATANATGESVQKIIDVFAILGDTTASGKHMCPSI